MKKGIYRKLNINSLANVVRYTFYMVVTFFLTPFIINTIGDSSYGLWVLILSFVGYASILEMGIQTALVKLVSESLSSGEHARVNRYISSVFLIFTVVGILILLIFTGILPRYVDHFIKFEVDGSVVRSLLIVIGLDAFLMFFTYLFSSVLYGLQRYHIKSAVDIFFYSSYATLVFALLKGSDILALAIIKTVNDACATLILALACKLSYRQLRISLTDLDLSTFRTIFSYAGRIFTSATMSRISNNADPLIITYFLSNFWTAVYAIPKRLLGYITELIWAMSAGFMPMFSDLDGKDDKETIKTIYLNYTRYLLFFILPMICLAAVYSTPFIRIWIGPDYSSKTTLVVIFLTVSVLMENYQPLIWRLFIGIGHLNYLVKISAFSSGLYIVLSLILIQRFGITGIAFSAMVRMTILQIIFLRYTSKYLEIPVRTFLARCSMGPVMSAIPLLLSGFALLKTFEANSYLSIMAQCAAVLLMYGMVVIFLGISHDERTFMAQALANFLQGNPS